jgi:hypothetical protein
MENNEEHVDGYEVLFFEHHAAAQSLKSAWTRLASTYGCIMIVLSRKKLTIRPHWFAKWLISLIGLDLNHEIPITRIRGIMEMGKWFSYGKVELRFETAEGEDRRLLLYMKKYREFVDKATKAINQ